jgi:hypothetical protein
MDIDTKISTLDTVACILYAGIMTTCGAFIVATAQKISALAINVGLTATDLGKLCYCFSFQPFHSFGCFGF